MQYGPTQTNRQFEATPNFFLDAVARGAAGQELMGNAQTNVYAGQRNTENNQYKAAMEDAQRRWYAQNEDLTDALKREQQQPYWDQKPLTEQARQASAYASAGSSNASAARTRQGAGFDAQLQPGLLTNQRLDAQIKQGAANKAGGTIWDQMPPTQQAEANQKLFNIDRQVASMEAVGDWMDKSGKALSSTDRTLANQEWQLTAKPMVMELLNTGVISNEAEAEALRKNLGEVNNFFDLTDTNKKLVKNLVRKAQQRRADTYSSYGRGAPPTPKASSDALFGNMETNAKPVGKVVPYTPGGAGQVQRY